MNQRKSNSLKDILLGAKRVADCNYIYTNTSDPVALADAHEDLLLRCLVCGKKIRLYQREVIEVGNYYKITGCTADGVKAHLEDGSEFYLCWKCLGVEGTTGNK